MLYHHNDDNNDKSLAHTHTIVKLSSMRIRIYKSHNIQYRLLLLYTTTWYSVVIYPFDERWNGNVEETDTDPIESANPSTTCRRLVVAWA